MMKALLEKLELQQLRIITIGAGVVVITLIAISYVVPAWKTARAADQEIALLEDALRGKSELDKQLQAQQSRIETLRRKLSGDMANLPPQQVEAYIIGRLQRVSWNNDVELVSVQPANGEQVQIFQEMLFTVRLVGRYDDLYRWLWETREELGYVVVKEFGLSRQSDADTDPLLLANLSLASYRPVE